MQRIKSLEVISKEFTDIYKATEHFTVDLADSRFIYAGTDRPHISHGGSTYFIDNEWVCKQLCKLIGVTPKFYTRSPEDLSEENLNTHSQLLKDSQKKVVLVSLSANSGFTVRGIIQEDYFQMTNLDVIKEVCEHLEENNVKGIRDLSGVGPLNPDWMGIVVSSYTTTLGEREWNRGYLIVASELGASKLFLSPVLYNEEKDQFFVLQRPNGKMVLEAKYENPKNGTLIPNIRNALAVGDTLFNDKLSATAECFSEIFESQRDVYELLLDWETRKNLSNSIVKKVRQSLDVQDEGEYTSTLGELCEIFLEESMNSNLAVALKTSGFVANKLGFSG